MSEYWFDTPDDTDWEQLLEEEHDEAANRADDYNDEQKLEEDEKE